MIELSKQLNNFSKQNILVVGDLILDEYIFGEVSRISPEAPVPIVDVREKTHAAGGSANVAMNIANLKGKVFLCGVIGDDEQGEILKDINNRAGINTSGIVVDDSRLTTVKTRIIAHEQQVVRVDWENRVPISKLIQEKILSKIFDFLGQVNIVVISDYDKGVNRKKLVEETIQLAKKEHIPIIIDPKAKKFEKYQNATVLTPNKKEASIASDTNIKDRRSLLKAAETLLKLNNLEYIVITLGSEGIFLYEANGNNVQFPAHTHEVYDVTGAGDTVIAVLSLCMATGLTLSESAKIANIAAGISVSKLGAATVTQEELILELNRK